MLRIPYTFLVCSAIAFAQLEASETSTSQEVTVPVSPENLVLENDNILVTVDGVLVAVHSLEKVADQWIAKIKY